LALLERTWQPAPRDERFMSTSDLVASGHMPPLPSNRHVLAPVLDGLAHAL
jgi:hypothetical protein